MAEVRRFPFARHLRGEPNAHILKYRAGRLTMSGRGLSFWFLPLSTSIAEVPIDNRELSFAFHGRSEDFQDVTVQGVITYRVDDPAKVAERVDFNIDLQRGTYLREPLEKLSMMITQLAQQFAAEVTTSTPIAELLKLGIEPLRGRIQKGLLNHLSLVDTGLVVVSVHVSSIKPSPDLEKAMEAPIREHIQQAADVAAFDRRAAAVQNERAIRENELQNQIELAKTEQHLIDQQGLNARRRVKEEAEEERIRSDGETLRQRLAAETRAECVRFEGIAEAERLQMVGKAQADTEKLTMDAYRDLPSNVLWGLAAKELGANLQHIDHLNVSPDLLAPLLTSFLEGSKRPHGTVEGQ